MRTFRIILSSVVAVGVLAVASYYVVEIKEGRIPIAQLLGEEPPPGSKPGAPGGGAPGGNPAMRGMPVPVTPVVKKTIPIMLDYAARAESIRSITLLSRVTGYVAEQPAVDGSDVK